MGKFSILKPLQTWGSGLVVSTVCLPQIFSISFEREIKLFKNELCNENLGIERRYLFYFFGDLSSILNDFFLTDFKDMTCYLVQNKNFLIIEYNCILGAKSTLEHFYP